MKTETQTRVYPARLDGSGRIVLPAEVRMAMGITAGDTVLIVPEGESLRVETPRQAALEMQRYFQSMVPADVSLADELIAERRLEAEHD
jgi:AbrB family looped-hinge helix DNA binding protein